MSEGGVTNGGKKYDGSLREIASGSNITKEYDVESNRNFVREETPIATSGGEHHEEYFHAHEFNRNSFYKQTPSLANGDKHYDEFLEFSRSYLRQETAGVADGDEQCPEEFFQAKENLDKNSPGPAAQTKTDEEETEYEKLNRTETRRKRLTKMERVEEESDEELTLRESRKRNTKRGDDEKYDEEFSRTEAHQGRKDMKSDDEDEEYDEEFCRDLSFSSTETAFLCAFSGVSGVLYSCGGLDWALPRGQRSDSLRVAGVDGQDGSDLRWLSCGFFMLMLFLGLFMAAGLRRRDGDLLKKSAVLCCLMAILHIFFVGSLVVFHAEGEYFLVLLTAASSLFLFYQSMVLWCYSTQLDAREDLACKVPLDAIREDVDGELREQASPSRPADGWKSKMM